MMRVSNITIPGTPIAKKRPRFFSKTLKSGKSFVGAYNPQETEDGRFLWEVKQQWHDKPIEGPVIIRIRFIFERPKSHFGTGRNAANIKSSSPQYHLQRPDIDNLKKFVFDCLNGVCWKDDCQIVKVFALKGWGDKSETEIEIRSWFDRQHVQRAPGSC